VLLAFSDCELPGVTGINLHMETQAPAHEGWREAVTGYHRIAVDTIQALSGASAASIVLNVANQGTLTPLLPTDVVEVNCAVDENRIIPSPPSAVPPQVHGLIESTKAFERAFIRASISGTPRQLQWALTQHPLIRDWDAAGRLIRALSLTA